VNSKWSVTLITGLLLGTLLYGCSGGDFAPQIEVDPNTLDPGTETASPATPDFVPASDTSPLAKLVVTTDFGKSLVLEETVEIGDETSALAALQEVALVETKYGGGFVRSINGIDSEYEGASKQKNDWLFYINGISVRVGAAGYILQAQDVEHWDFRDWSFRQYVPAIIGDFPEPFVHGYGGKSYPTVVVYQEGWQEEAVQIADKLSESGVVDVSYRPDVDLSDAERASDNLILVGTSNAALITEINEPWNKLGFYARFEEDGLSVYTASGELAAKHTSEVGIIQATQSPWNPSGTGVCENVVWMVSGTDETGVKQAVDTLVNRQDSLKYAYAVVVTSDQIVKVP
jgi:hypothetical protein